MTGLDLTMYMLDADGNVVATKDETAWQSWIGNFDNRRVARDYVGDVEISTVFLPCDHGFDAAAPVLFETMVFGGELDQEQRRYSTRTAALAGHAELLAAVRRTTMKLVD